MKLAWILPLAWPAVLLCAYATPKNALAQETTAEQEAQSQEDRRGFPPPSGLTRLAKDGEVWIDLKRKLVVVDGQVVLRRGALEMFACPKGTKEHESIVAVDGKAQHVHAGLLAVGAESGNPVRYEPEYVPASGTRVDIWILWKDEDGEKHQKAAQHWIRNAKTEKEMQHHWVFAGSGFSTDPSDGKQYYYGDAGDFICVSNFPSATLDLPVKSPQENSSLLFEAFTERIPPVETPVRLVLKPRLDVSQDEDAQQNAERGDLSRRR